MDVATHRPFVGPFAAFAALGVFWGGWAVLVPTVQTAVGATKAELGLALVGVALGAVPAMLAWGRWLARLLPRPLPVALVSLAGAAFLPALAGSVWTLLLALVAVGAASGLLDVAMNTEVAALEAETGRRRMQLAHALFSVGVIGGAIVSGLLREAGAGRVAVVAVLAGLVLGAAAANAGRRRRPVDVVRRPLRLRRTIALLGLGTAAAFMVESGIENWSALFLQRELGAGAAVSALGPASYAAAMAIGRLLGQRLTGSIGDRRLLVAGALLSTAGLVTASLAHVVPVAAVAFFAGGAGISIAVPIFVGAAGRDPAPAERAPAVSLVSTIGYTGFLVGLPLVGGIAQAVGLRASFVALAGVALLLAAAAPRLAPERAGAAAPTTTS